MNQYKCIHQNKKKFTKRKKLILKIERGRRRLQRKRKRGERRTNKRRRRDTEQYRHCPARAAHKNKRLKAQEWRQSQDNRHTHTHERPPKSNRMASSSSSSYVNRQKKGLFYLNRHFLFFSSDKAISSSSF